LVSPGQTLLVKELTRVCMCKLLRSSQEPENELSSIRLSSCQHTEDKEEWTIQMSVDQNFIFLIFPPPS